VGIEALREPLTGEYSSAGPNISLRCLAYALPPGPLGCVVIVFGIAVIAGR
jgi:hypothetical protein